MHDLDHPIVYRCRKHRQNPCLRPPKDTQLALWVGPALALEEIVDAVHLKVETVDLLCHVCVARLCIDARHLQGDETLFRALLGRHHWSFQPDTTPLDPIP
jgi:hypothetical protein